MRSLTLLALSTAEVDSAKLIESGAVLEIGRLIGIKIDGSKDSPDDSEGSDDAGYEEEAPAIVNARHQRSENGDTFGYSTTFEDCPIHSLYDACAALTQLSHRSWLGWSMIMQQGICCFAGEVRTDSYVRAQLRVPYEICRAQKLDKNGSSWCIKMAD